VVVKRAGRCGGGVRSDLMLSDEHGGQPGPWADPRAESRWSPGQFVTGHCARSQAQPKQADRPRPVVRGSTDKQAWNLEAPTNGHLRLARGPAPYPSARQHAPLCLPRRREAHFTAPCRYGLGIETPSCPERRPGRLIMVGSRRRARQSPPSPIPSCSPRCGRQRR